MPDTITKRIEEEMQEIDTILGDFLVENTGEDSVIISVTAIEKAKNKILASIVAIRTETVDACLAEIEKKFEEHSIADGIVYDEGLPPADILPEMIRDIHIAREATNGTLKELKNALKQSLAKLKE